MDQLRIMSSGITIKAQDLPSHNFLKESMTMEIQLGTKSLKKMRESVEGESIKTYLN
jgi:hypothetical protein